MSAPLSRSGYSSGHPWFYVLGGKPPTPKQILELVRVSKYRGYMQDEIATADKRCEPRRSEDLRYLRARALGRFRTDLSGYRRAVRNLHALRLSCDEPECAEEHVSVSLKHNHVFNELAHLAWIDELLSHQLDLFEC